MTFVRLRKNALTRIIPGLAGLLLTFNGSVNACYYFAADHTRPILCTEEYPATIVGTDGDDVLRGTSGNDVIHGLGGNDTIEGLGGNDIICGGPGNDTILGGSGRGICGTDRRPWLDGPFWRAHRM